MTLREFVDEYRARVDREAEKLRAEQRRRAYDGAVGEREEDVKYEDGVLTGYEQALAMLDEVAGEADDDDD